jgi:hypothetical protein
MLVCKKIIKFAYIKENLPYCDNIYKYQLFLLSGLPVPPKKDEKGALG